MTLRSAAQHVLRAEVCLGYHTYVPSYKGVEMR